MFRDLIQALRCCNAAGEPEGRYRPRQPLWFREFLTGRMSDQPGVGAVDWDDRGIRACAVMRDRDIFNTAVTDNSETWLSGDVFELFWQWPNCMEYHEAHVTPGGVTLQLRIPDHRAFRAIPHRDKVCDFGLAARARTYRWANVWGAELRLPFAGFGRGPGDVSGSRFVLVRYNYTGTQPPEITASRVFPATAHAPIYWHTV